MYKYITITILMLLGLQIGMAQSYQLSKNSEVTFSGTSSLHDWTMEAENVDGTGIFVVENGQLKKAQNLEVSIEAESLKSGKSGMDDNAYKALNTKRHKTIDFKLESLKPTSNPNKMIATGKLTIAGKTRTIKMNADCDVNSNGHVTCSGAVPLKMTDFDVDPPTAMFGTIKTGDDITVNFKTIFTKQVNN